MAEKRMPAAERQRESTARALPVSSRAGAVITGRIPDLVPGPKGS